MSNMLKKYQLPADRPCLICQLSSDPEVLNRTSSITLDKSSSGNHLQKAPRHPEAENNKHNFFS